MKINLFPLHLSASLFVASMLSLLSETSPGLQPEETALVERARRAPASESWAKLSGRISNRIKGSETKEHDIRVGIRFTPQMIFAQILIDNKESYTVSQGFGSTRPTIIKEGDPESRIMEQVGLRPEELTLSFMYWNPESFLGDKTFKSSRCAEIAMRSQDSGEKALVLINREHAFPLRVEWFKNGETTPSRTMEVSSFKKENDYWFVDEILLYGPGWKTKLAFTDTKAGPASDGIPDDIFRKTLPPPAP